MIMPRPQFSIRTLLWLTLVVAAFLGGMVVEQRIEVTRRADPNNPSDDIVRFTIAPTGDVSGMQ
jgi:hypothetical protein